MREGDEFHVTGGFDMSGEEFTGTEVPQEFMDNFEFRISITFPGEVTSSTGAVDGNTVTWEPKIGQNTRIEAVASAIPSSSSPVLLIVLIAVGALALGALVYFLTHRTPAPAAGPTTGFDTTAPPEGSAGTPSTLDPPSSAPHPRPTRLPETRRRHHRHLRASPEPMPTYEYRCGSCGATFESRRAIAQADDAIACPHGHDDTVRQLSVFAVTSTAAIDSRSRPAGTGCGPGCACVGSSGQGQMA